MTFTLKVTFDRPTASGRVSVVGDLPALVGSAKQVSWAEDLRTEALYKVAEDLCRSTKTVIGTMRSDETDAIADANARLAAIFTLPGGDKMGAALAKMFATADAKWWIDNRFAAPSVALAKIFRSL